MEKDRHPTILVIGATGREGRAVIEALGQRTIAVRALVGSPSRAARSLERDGIHVFGGNVDDSDSLRQAMDGADGVFLVQGFAEPQSEIDQGLRTAELAYRAGVSHFVYCSAAGADRHTGIASLEAKAVVEQALRDLSLPYTIVRPVFLMDNWLSLASQTTPSLIIAQPLAESTPLQQIAIADIGAVIAQVFENSSEWIGREIDLAGDETAVGEIAPIAAHFLGRPARLEPVSWDRFRWQHGEETTRLFHWLEEVGYGVPLETRRSEFRLATLGEFFFRRRGDWEKTARRAG